MTPTKLKANYVNIFSESINEAEITLNGSRIGHILILKNEINPLLPFILPGFVDAHIHIESSLMPPSSFGQMAVAFGTVGTVSDPHEIANVLCIEGVKYMIENARNSPVRFCFGVPSCVPATTFETAGAELNLANTATLFQNFGLTYLAEMMNYPGVINNVADVTDKIRLAQNYGKPVDGHAPGLTGEMALKYINAGISTDHECSTLEEAEFKAQNGQYILIREGSAAKNFEALWPILNTHPEKVMFCSDDKHPDSLAEGHIDLLVKRALLKGIPLFKVLKAACITPVLHYKTGNGLLRIGDPADFIVVENLLNPLEMKVLQTRINGDLVFDRNKLLPAFNPPVFVNNFFQWKVQPEMFGIRAKNNGPVKVIIPTDGQLITMAQTIALPIENGFLMPDSEQDILKIVVVNRYHKAQPAVAFIQNFGFKIGALASSVAHDSHNIIAVGSSDNLISQAINLIMDEKGGLCALRSENDYQLLPLPIAGLMSNLPPAEVTEKYIALDRMAKEMGSTLSSPFMTLSFMALLVIPFLKLSDKGLFDGGSFSFTNLQN